MSRLQSSLPRPAGSKLVVIGALGFNSGLVVSTIWLVTVHRDAEDRAFAPVAFSIKPKVAVKTPVCPSAEESVKAVTVPVTLTVMMLLVAAVALNQSPCDPLAGLLLLCVSTSEDPDKVLLNGTVKKLGSTCVLAAHAVLVLLFCVVRYSPEEGGL